MTVDSLPYEHLMDAIHPFVDSKGKLYKLLDAIQKEIEGIREGIDLVKDASQLDNSLGTDLDKVGGLMDLTRVTGQTDEAYRTDIGSAVSTLEHQTLQAVKDVVEWLTGYIPTIKEYPEVDFVTKYGTPKNEGFFLVTVPTAVVDEWPEGTYGWDIQKWGISQWNSITPEPGDFTDIKLHVNRVKAAGTAFFVDFIQSLIEYLSETVLIDDWLIPIIGFREEMFKGGWDEQDWDTYNWDTEPTVSDVLELFCVMYHTDELPQHNRFTIGTSKIGDSDVIDVKLPYYDSVSHILYLEDAIF